MPFDHKAGFMLDDGKHHPELALGPFPTNFSGSHVASIFWYAHLQRVLCAVFSGWSTLNARCVSSSAQKLYG
jgi:hypothetical protein